MQNHRQRSLAAACALALASLLAACDKPAEPSTAGEKLDAGIAQVERKTEEVRSDLARAGKEASDALASATENVATKARDAAITAKVNAELARDEKLSAVRIDVDTTEGRVLLAGTAPDDASRERATKLARAVEGVVAVDNRLNLAPRT